MDQIIYATNKSIPTEDQVGIKLMSHLISGKEAQGPWMLTSWYYINHWRNWHFRHKTVTKIKFVLHLYWVTLSKSTPKTIKLKLLN